VDDIVAKVLCTKLFLEAQGYKVKKNLIVCDNGKASSGQRTRHFNIKLFYITDLIKSGEVSIQYCPTDAMLADYMTKPLTGTKFSSCFAKCS
jgi:hypothetical protein